MNAYCVPTICLPLCDQEIKYAKENFKHVEGLDLADTGEGELEVDLLIGSNFYWSVLTGKVLKGNGCGPVALESKVGWILSGSLGKSIPSKQHVNYVGCHPTHVVFIETKNTDISENKLSNFWDLETLGISANENHPDQTYINQIKVNDEGAMKYSCHLKLITPF